MWKQAPPNSAAPYRGVQPETANAPQHAPGIPQQPPVQVHDQAVIGKSVMIKGEVSGSEALRIEGRVEGSIHLPNHRVTIGRNGVVNADINAGEVVINGEMRGNVTAQKAVEICSHASLTGDVVTSRLSIEEGAFLVGKIEIRRPEQPAAEVQPEPGMSDACAWRSDALATVGSGTD